MPPPPGPQRATLGGERRCNEAEGVGQDRIRADGAWLVGWSEKMRVLLRTLDGSIHAGRAPP